MYVCMYVCMYQPSMVDTLEEYKPMVLAPRLKIILTI